MFVQRFSLYPFIDVCMSEILVVFLDFIYNLHASVDCFYYSLLLRGLMVLQWIALDWKQLEHVFYDIWNSFFLLFEQDRLLPYISIPWKSPNLFYSNLCVLHSYRTWHVSWATSTPCYDVGLTAVKLNIIEFILKREAKIPRYLRLLVNSEEIRNVLIFLNCHVVNISHC